MKSLKNYSALAAFAVILFTASCQKDSLDTIAPSIGDNTQQDQQVDPIDAGSNERNMGVQLLPEVEYMKLPKIEEDEIGVASLPTSKYLTCPPIRNQGGEGSCVAFGTGYSARSIAKFYKTGAASYSNSTNLYSPEYLYNQIKVNSNCGSGAYVTAGLNKMKALFLFGGGGVCTWSMMPYSSVNGCSTQPNSTQKANAYNNAISGYSTVPVSINSIKNQLVLNRAVIVAGPVDQGFANLGFNQTYTQYNSSQFLGNHCYTVVGYSDAKQAFKVMNSWGTSWGTNGFGWIKYSAVCTTIPLFPPISISTGLWSEAYVITGSF